MAAAERSLNILIMGVGNALMQDDAVGTHVTDALRASPDTPPYLDIIDGGTIGLSLLPQMEDADAVIIVDAAEIKAEPGTIRLFRDEEIDKQLSGKRRTVHEVALVDMFSAAAIRGRMPARRALVAIQPECTEWGVDLTPPVQAAVPGACAAILELVAQWQDAEVAA